MNQALILLVEDDAAIARGVTDALQQDGHHVVWRAGGFPGMDVATQQHPNLILLDVRLPDGNGFDFCRQMRAMGVRAPILFLTVQADETDKVLGLEMGGDDYLTKPFGVRELRSRVRALLRRAYGELASASGELLFVHDLVIDRGRMQVLRGREVLNLTPIEFRLLLVLAQHNGRVLSREQLLDAVWGNTSDVESDKTVNVHIRRLRMKIEPVPENPQLILTVPGAGYRLNMA